MRHGEDAQSVVPPPPAVQVTTYFWIGEPPLYCGGSQETVACLPAIRSGAADTPWGAVGLPSMVTDTRPSASRPGPSLTVTATEAVGEGWVPAVKVRVQPLALTVSAVPDSTVAVWIAHWGFSRGESR